MARDIYHRAVVNALEKDGWTVTHDPLRLEDKDARMYYEADLGAEKLLVAEKGTDKIAVEIKSFLKASIVSEFHGILGQYITYADALEFLSDNRQLILAIPKFAEERLREYPFILRLIEKHGLKILVFDEVEETIIVWKR